MKPVPQTLDEHKGDAYRGGECNKARSSTVGMHACRRISRCANRDAAD
jgi:hypothetical protein